MASGLLSYLAARAHIQQASLAAQATDGYDSEDLERVTTKIGM